MAHHWMLKETHTISYIQQASYEWIEGDEEETHTISYIQQASYEWIKGDEEETHTISYIQQDSYEWIEGDEEETVYAQVTESLRVVPIDIQHGPEVL
jgi:hypothetical protein